MRFVLLKGVFCSLTLAAQQTISKASITDKLNSR